MIDPVLLEQWTSLAAAATPGPMIAELDQFRSEDGIVALVTQQGSPPVDEMLMMSIPTECLPTPQRYIDAEAEYGDLVSPRYRGPKLEWLPEDEAAKNAAWAKAKESQALKDARFYAAAREAVPALLKEREELLLAEEAAESVRDAFEAAYNQRTTEVVLLREENAALRADGELRLGAWQQSAALGREIIERKRLQAEVEAFEQVRRSLEAGYKDLYERQREEIARLTMLKDLYFDAMKFWGAKASTAEKLKTEVEMLRGVDCLVDGDGPCGACLKCARADVAKMRPVYEAANAWRENAYLHNRSWTVPDEHDSALVSAIDAGLAQEGK